MGRSLLALLLAPLLYACSSAGGAEPADVPQEEDLTALRPFDRCDPGGPCPDLRLNVDVLRQSIVIESREVDPRSCSVNEGTIRQIFTPSNNSSTSSLEISITSLSILFGQENFASSKRFIHSTSSFCPTFSIPDNLLT